MSSMKNGGNKNTHVRKACGMVPGPAMRTRTGHWTGHWVRLRDDGSIQHTRPMHCPSAQNG